MSRFSRAIADAVRSVVESLEERRLYTHVISTIFSPLGKDQHLDVLLSDSAAGPVLSSQFTVNRLTFDQPPITDEMEPPPTSGGEIQVIPVTGPEVSTDQRTSTFKPTTPGPLKDGWYESTVHSDALEADDSDYESTFSFLNGDFNHDDSVDISDFNILAINLGKPGTWTFAEGDANYDGHVTISDFNLLAVNFGLSLPDLPSQAGGVVVGHTAAGALDVGWTANTDIRDGYKVYRSDDGGASYNLVQTIADPEARSWQDVGTTEAPLVLGHRYWYRVRAYTNASGASASTSKASGIPTDPANEIQVDVTPSASTLAFNASQTFTASVHDGYGHAMVGAPVTWQKVSGPGTINAAGTYIAGNSPGTAVIRAISGPASTTATITIGNTAPEINVAEDVTTSGTSAALHVSATDDGGDGGLTYGWTVASKPPGSVDPVFSVNNSASAKDTTVTFSQAGSYTFTAIVSDGTLSSSSTVAVQVDQTLTKVIVTPSVTALAVNVTQQFSAIGQDQFDDPLLTQPSFTWTIANGVGSITQLSGRFTSDRGGAATVRARTGNFNGEASVTVSNSAPTLASAAAAHATPVAGKSVTLTALGADDGGETNLIYTWTTTSKPTGAYNPTFSRNGTNAAKATSATFFKAGNYAFLVTVSDGALGVTSAVSVIVAVTPTEVSVTPTTSSVASGHEAAFAAEVTDQFGSRIQNAAITWSVVAGGGSFFGNIYTAGPAGSTTVKADAGGVSTDATVVVINAPPAVKIDGDPNNDYGSPSSLAFDVTATDPDGNSSLLAYTWSVWQEGAPLSLGNSNVHSSHFSFLPPATGAYEIRVAIQDAGGATTAASHLVSVGNALGTAAVADDIVARPGGAMIQLNVLANDVIAAGQTASVVAVTQPSHGGVTIGGSGSYQISYLPADGFSGNDTFSYVIADNNGVQHTANVNLSILSGAGVSIAAGIPEGTQDYTINDGFYVNPRSSFKPVSRGNFRFTTSVVRSVTSPVNGGTFGSLQGDGATTQAITVISTDLPNGVWGYTESVITTDNFSTHASTEEDFSGHEIKSDTYTFTASGDVSQSAFGLTGTANSGGWGDAVQDQVTFHWTTSGEKVAVIGNHTDFDTNVITPVYVQSGSDEFHASAIIPYAYDVVGGSVSGVNTQSSGWVGNYSYSLLAGSYSQTETDGWQYAGSGSAVQSHTNTDSTGGTSAATVANTDSVSSTLTESGHGGSDSHYTIRAAWSGAAWTTSSGDGDAHQIQHGDSTTTSTGVYSHLTTQTSGSSSIAGNMSASQSSSWDSENSIEQTLVGGEWAIVTGTGEAYGHTDSSSSYQGSGTYAQADTVMSGGLSGAAAGVYHNSSSNQNGTVEEKGKDQSSTSYSIDSSWADDDWANTGNSDAGSTASGTLTTAGGGSYTHATTSSKGDSSIGGTTGTSETNQWSSESTLHQTLGIDGDWVITTGSGQQAGGDIANSSYGGHGSYTRHDSSTGKQTGTVAGFTNSSHGSGSANESGHDATTASYSIQSEWTDGSWANKGGSESTTSATGEYSSGETGFYTHTTSSPTVSTSVTGTTGSSQHNVWSSDSSLASSLGSDGNWSLSSGLYQSNGTDVMTSSYAGGGTAVRHDIPDNGTVAGTATGTYSNTKSGQNASTTEKGSTSFSTHYDTRSDWSGTNWIDTGHSKQADKNDGEWHSTGTEHYTHTTNTNQANTTISGATDAHEDNDWGSGGTITQSLTEDGNWVVSSGGVSYAGHNGSGFSYHGDGVISLADTPPSPTTADMTVSNQVNNHQTGTESEHGDGNSSSSYTIHSNWSNGSWVNTGNSGYTDHGDNSTSSTVTGQYTHTATADKTRSSVSGTTGFTQTNVWGTKDDGTQTLGANGTWTFSGGHSSYTGHDHTDASAGSTQGTISTDDTNPSGTLTGGNQGTYHDTGTGQHGSITEKWSQSLDSTYDIHASWISGDWVTGGTSRDSTKEDSETTLKSTGTYSHSTTSATASDSSNVTGTTNNSHTVKSHTDSLVDSSLNASGEWTVTLGTANATGSDTADYGYSGTGTYDDGRKIDEGGTNSLKTEYDIHPAWSPTQGVTGDWLTDSGNQTATTLEAGHWASTSTATHASSDTSGMASITHAVTWDVKGTVEMSLASYGDDEAMGANWEVNSAAGDSTGSTRDDWTYTGTRPFVDGYSGLAGQTTEENHTGTVSSYDIQSHWDSDANNGDGKAVGTGVKTTGTFDQGTWLQSGSVDTDYNPPQSTNHYHTDISRGRTSSTETTATQTLGSTGSWEYASTTSKSTNTTDDTTFSSTSNSGPAGLDYTFNLPGTRTDNFSERRGTSESYTATATRDKEGHTSYGGDGFAKREYSSTNSFSAHADVANTYIDQEFGDTYISSATYDTTGSFSGSDNVTTSWTVDPTGHWQSAGTTETLKGSGNAYASDYRYGDDYNGVDYEETDDSGGWSTQDRSYDRTITSGVDTNGHAVVTSDSGTGHDKIERDYYLNSENSMGGSDALTWHSSYSDVWSSDDTPASHPLTHTASMHWTSHDPDGTIHESSFTEVPYFERYSPPWFTGNIGSGIPGGSPSAPLGSPPGPLPTPPENPVPPHTEPPAPPARPAIPADDAGSWATRGFGVLKAVGGVLEFAGGAAVAVGTAPTGVGLVGGTIVAYHGADTAFSGLWQVWTGEETRTLTAQVTEAGAALVVDAKTAERIGTGVDLAVGIGGIAVTAGASWLGSGTKLAAASGEARALAGAAEAAEAGAAAKVARVAEEAGTIGCFLAGTPVLLGDDTTTVSIETVHAGDRLKTDGGVANSSDGKTKAVDPNATAVDPKAWKLIRISTSDGDWQVQTLEPASWIAAHGVVDGARIELSQVVNLKDMGVPDGLYGTVESIEACPPIESGTGRVVLTTASHLNNFVFDLTLTDAAGHSDTIGITGYHKVYTEDRGWVSAEDLVDGEAVRGDHGNLTVSSLVRAGGTSRVYNLNVENDHIYYVGDLAALVHNTCVYQSVDNAGNVIYVGITEDFERRAAEHLLAKGINIARVPGLENVTRFEARAVEQALIDRYGIANLLNKINSISISNPKYKQAASVAATLLRALKI